MKKIVVAVPHSHTWFWTQTCVASLLRYPPKADGFEVAVIVVDNSPWSPAVRGLTNTDLVTGGNWNNNPVHLKSDVGFRSFSVVGNSKSNKFHASALDCVVDDLDAVPYDFHDYDYLMAMETDVLALRPDWLQWFVDQMRDTDFAVGHWHHEQFVNPSCTLYRGSVLRGMAKWCRSSAEPETLRWGPLFGKSQPVADRQPDRDYKSWYDDNIEWIAGPFADKRGWPVGTELKEQPSGQMKGPGWYEPGQMLHHWAVQQGHTYTVCPTHTHFKREGMPVQTVYGYYTAEDADREMNIFELRKARNQYMVDVREGRRDGHSGCDTASGHAMTVHLWGGTRALDIVKHEVTCQFVASNTPYWLEREARFWVDTVPQDVREATLELIRKHSWHYHGQGTPFVSDRDRAAVRMIRECYARGGVEW